VATLLSFSIKNVQNVGESGKRAPPVRNPHSETRYLPLQQPYGINSGNSKDDCRLQR
jgi:hypothetical protein